MWKLIFDTICKSLSDDPKLVEQVVKADQGFEKWVQYYNPNDIGVLDEKDKVVVEFLSEDLQDLKMRAAYFVFLFKKSQGEDISLIWTFLNDTINAHFWLAVRTKYKLWEYHALGLRDGFKVVVMPPCDHNLPDVLKRLFGG